MPTGKKIFAPLRGRGDSLGMGSLLPPISLSGFRSSLRFASGVLRIRIHRVASLWENKKPPLCAYGAAGALRSLRELRGGENNSKTDVVVTISRIVPAPASTASEPTIVEPGAAAHHASILFLIVPIQIPFPYIPAHIHCPGGTFTTKKLSNRCS